MPFTDSMAWLLMCVLCGMKNEPARAGLALHGRNLPRLLAFLGAIALGQLLFQRILFGRGTDHRLDDLLVGFIAVFLHLPLLAVPHVQGRGAPTRVVDA